MGTVGEWLDVGQAPAVHALNAAGYRAEAEALEKLITGPAETFGGVEFEAKAGAQGLRSADVLAWVTPDDTRPTFDVAAFTSSTDTLYLLSDDSKGQALGPLLAAFVSEVFAAATSAAAHHTGGRLDPPMVAVLDEAANICPIENLPALYSHLGSRLSLIHI